MSVPSRRPVVTLLTDYGITDEFAGVDAGVIAKICPDARIINLSHGIIRHDIRGGAMTLAQSLPYMPIGVHFAVVDPTVGGDRRAVALRLADGRYLVGPDNGLLWPAAEECGGVEQAVEISHSRWRLEPVSPTFHGRDIFAPVAAHLAAGDPFEDAGERISPGTLVRIETQRPWMEGGSLVVSVDNADRFGNLQLAAKVDDLVALGAKLGDRVEIRLASGQLHTATFSLTFSDVGEGELIVYNDSAQRLAVGGNSGSAMVRLGLRPEDTRRITGVHDA